MIVKEIKVGGDYFVGGFAMGRAHVVSEPERKYPNSRIFHVEVEYPDAGPEIHNARKTTKMQTKDILREWTTIDQEKFKKSREKIENKRGWEEELRQAGFDGVVNYEHDGKIYVTFRGRAAEILLQHLTGHEMPKDD